MADYRCSIGNCSDIPKISCSCQDPPLLLCEGHTVSHYETGILTDHVLKPIFAKLNSEEISIVQQIKARLLQMRNQSIAEINRNYFTQIKGISEQFSEQIKAVVASFNNFLAILDKSLVSSLSLRSSTNKLLLKLKALSETSLDRRDEELDRTILALLDSSFVKSLFPVSGVKKERFNYYYKQKKKNLIEVDNQNLTKRKINIDYLTENLGGYAGHCSLEDSNIFYCVRQTNKNISSCYKIDPIDKKILKLASLPIPLRYVIPIRLEKNIFVFGGYDDNGGNGILQNFKYSIQDNRWENISELPMKSCLSSSILIEKSFLVVGYFMDGIYEYKNNNYDKIMDLSTENNGHKVLLKNKDGELFLLFNSKIYKSSVNNYYHWKQVGSYNGVFNSHICSTPQLWEDHFCFLIYPNRYIRFNYKTLDLEEPDLN